MIIGHLPSGYLAARTIWPETARATMIAALIGSVLPDLDILYFYLIDNRSTHHHEYITHRPIIWFAVFLAGILLRRATVVALGLAALLHMVLDSIAGKIAWGWPFSHHAEPFVVVPATHEFWVFSFLTHWTFKVEIAVTLLALIVAWRSNFRKD